MPIPLVAGVIASGALSALGNFFGSKSAASAQAKANEQNIALQRETNAQNLQMFRDSRGASGSAILPEYLKGYEADLGNQAAKTAGALFNYGGTTAQRMTRANDVLARYKPALDAGDATVIDLASGGGLTQAPVNAARLNLAKSRADSINQSLDETLAGLRSARTQRGFRGSSTFDTNRTLAATTGARMGAATEMGQARLDNASQDLQMLLQSLDLPFQRGQQRLAWDNLPVSSVAGSYNDAMAPLNFFRLPVAGNMPYQSAPQVGAVPNTGQIVGAAVAGGAQSIGQYLAQQQMMQQLQRMYQYQGGPASAPSENFGTYGDSPYW